MEDNVNRFGIPTDPETASRAVKEGRIATSDKEKVKNTNEGDIIETFSIKVKDDNDVVVYESENQPFGWTKVAGLAGIFSAEDSPLTENAIDLLGDIFPGEACGKTVQKLIDLYNDANRSNAKAAEYQRISNLKTPVSAEDRKKKLNKSVDLYMQLAGVTREVALEQLRKANPALFA